MQQPQFNLNIHCLNVMREHCLCRLVIVRAPEMDSKLNYSIGGVLGCFYGFKTLGYIRSDFFVVNFYNIYQGGMI